MRDRHSGTLGGRRSINLGLELLRKRLDDTGSQPGFALSEGAVWLADPIVGDRKLPVRSDHVIRDSDLTLGLNFGKGMLQGIHDEFGHDQAEALGLTGTRCRRHQPL